MHWKCQQETGSLPPNPFCSFETCMGSLVYAAKELTCWKCIRERGWKKGLRGKSTLAVVLFGLSSPGGRTEKENVVREKSRNTVPAFPLPLPLVTILLQICWPTKRVMRYTDARENKKSSPRGPSVTSAVVRKVRSVQWWNVGQSCHCWSPMFHGRAFIINALPGSFIRIVVLRQTKCIDAVFTRSKPYFFMVKSWKLYIRMLMKLNLGITQSAGGSADLGHPLQKANIS